MSLQLDRKSKIRKQAQRPTWCLNIFEARWRRGKIRGFLLDVWDLTVSLFIVLALIALAGAPLFCTLLLHPGYMKFCDDGDCPANSRCVITAKGEHHCLCVGARKMVNGQCMLYNGFYTPMKGTGEEE
ncbi:uncharacterized protein LOC111267321 isoform X2 [Varroa jacobsoni]|nr:uncharacterized protein LOC111246164 isoform X2 [Varroa destructor]XP_022651055.1 uncharacterized protein LOC111246164 isoform X2 [Varroa destructor]XP_022701246.1 uncharacterized protein LOC111267321 isoform X2 [Varroa jacobsoni]